MTRGAAEVVADEVHAALGVELPAIVGDDAAGFLSAMLEGVQAERGDGGGVGVPKNTEDPAFLAEFSSSWREGAGSPRCTPAVEPKSHGHLPLVPAAARRRYFSVNARRCTPVTSAAPPARDTNMIIVAAVAAVAAVCCSVLASSAGAKVRALSPSQVSSIQWGPCTPGSDLDQLGAQCGTLSVPLDYNHPNGAHIQLAVSKLEHTSDAADYQGAILTNPGGPGGSGLDLSAILALVLDQEGYSAAAADYDWIGFDPRGVGASQPSLTCDPNYFAGPRPNYVPSSRQLLSFWENTSDRYGRNCARTSAAQYALLQNDTTIDTAKDMDSIRQALGQRQISYYGFSYGTYLGQVYSTLFPQNVRRQILDSNVDPRGVWYQDNFDQDVAFQRNIQIWFGWLAKYNSVYNLGSTEAQVYRTFNKAQNALAASPAGGEVGPDEWADIFLEAGYYEQTWEDLGSLFSEWINNPGPSSAADLVNAFESTDGVGDDNGYAGYLAVQCTDTAWPNSW